MTNIAVVVLDTLRKDTFDDHFGWLPGTRFDRAYSTANWTAPAHASLFTGCYGSEVGVTAKSRALDCPEPSLPELFHEAGYRTRGISANHNVSTKNNFDRGFDEFVNPSKLKNPGNENVLDWEAFLASTDATGPELYLRALAACVFSEYDTLESIRTGLGRKRSEDSGAAAALERLEAMAFGDREFVFLNLMEAHTPYDPPEPYNSVGGPVSVGIRSTFEGVDDPETVKRAYDDAARYLSDVYKRIFEALAADFDYIVTLSDHGEMLGEHGVWNHTYGLYPEVTHVPLVVTEVANPVDERRDDPVSLLDLHRTLLGLADVDGTSRGRDLRLPPEPQDRLAEYDGLIEHSKKELRTAGMSEAEIAAYDASFAALVGADGAYGVDSVDAAYYEGIDARDTRARIDDIYTDIERRAIEMDDDDDLGEETLEQLRELGYI